MLTDALAAAATLVSLAFALSTLERWLARRRRHELAWSISLLLFVAGSASLWAGSALGWGAWTLRAFYLFGGILNVPFLALGTVYLLGGPRRGDRAGAVVALLAAFATGVVVAVPLHRPVDPAEFPTGKDYFGVLPRVLAGVGSGSAALVLIVGALWSAGRLLRSRTRPGRAATTVPAGRLAAANVLIAGGTMLISAKQLFMGLGDEATAFSAALAVGITVVFAGFLLTVGPGGSRPAPSRSGATRAEPAALPSGSSGAGVPEGEPAAAGHP